MAAVFSCLYTTGSPLKTICQKYITLPLNPVLLLTWHALSPHEGGSLPSGQANSFNPHPQSHTDCRSTPWSCLLVPLLHPQGPGQMPLTSYLAVLASSGYKDEMFRSPKIPSLFSRLATEQKLWFSAPTLPTGTTPRTRAEIDESRLPASGELCGCSSPPFSESGKLARTTRRTANARSKRRSG